jgi:hypothetical protein
MGVINFQVLTNESGSVNSSYQRTYQKVFLVETDHTLPPYTVWEAGSVAGLPKIFDIYPHDPTGRAFCVSLSPVQDSANPWLWKVTASFAYTIDGWTGGGGGGGGSTATGNSLIDTQQAGTPPDQRQSAPLSRHRDYSYSTMVVGQETIRSAVDRNSGEIVPFVNTAGDPFPQPPTITIPGVQITVGLNSLEPPGGNWVAALHKLNKNPLTIDLWQIPARWARLESCSAQRVFEEGVSYYRWTVTFCIRENWNWRPLSMGNRAFFSVKNKKTGNFEDKKLAITEVDRFLTGPQLLDSAGKVVTSTNGRKAHVHDFDYLDEVVFPSPL